MIFTLIAQFGGGFTGPATGVFDPNVAAGGQFDSLNNILSLIVTFLTVLAGLAFLLYFIFGGLQWTLAGGDQGKVDSAKTQMTNGAIGLIIVVLSYGIIAVIGQVLGLQILNPGEVIQTQLNPSNGALNPDKGLQKFK
jgi:cytochrome bd-type quinol oxidase subunit 2